MELPADEMDKGMPIKIANEAASEKLSTVVIDITVDARQRFRAFRTGERGLVLGDAVCGTRRATEGSSENIMKAKGDAT